MLCPRLEIKRPRSNVEKMQMQRGLVHWESLLYIGWSPRTVIFLTIKGRRVITLGSPPAKLNILPCPDLSYGYSLMIPNIPLWWYTGTWNQNKQINKQSKFINFGKIDWFYCVFINIDNLINIMFIFFSYI